MDRLRIWRGCSIFVALLLLALIPSITSAAVTVKTVPLDPANPTAPHFTYPLDATHEVTIVLGGTVDPGGSTDPLTYSWNFGDGTAATPAAPVTNPYDISAKHQYPFGAAGGTTWAAVVTVTDTMTSAKVTGKYYVIQQANNLASRTNVAIDSGLWYLHQGMWRCNNGNLNGAPNAGCGVGGIFGPTGKFGGWDTNAVGCPSGSLACHSAESINGSNTQAFEVNGHLESGPTSDPYTEDVAFGLARMIMLLGNQRVASKTYNYNLPPSCPNGATTPCSYTFDGNTNGQAVFVQATGQPMYQGGAIIDAIVASGTPGVITHTGVGAGGGLPGINGISYKDLIQDMADGYNYCQNTFPTGGAWGYNCLNANYNDNSVSQWAAIGNIGANRGFGIPTPAVIMDANALWDTNDQCTSGSISGTFGYNGACNNVWGPYAVTPSGLVQLAMDKLGRGDSRWDMAETFYHDNFCNAPSGGALAAPRHYTYGMFSFTKSMLLHDPAGVLTPIKFLEDRPAGTNPIDWYSSVGPESGGADACDGVAQVLVKRQGVTGGGDGGSVGSPNPTSPENGYWTAHSSPFTGAQDPFETGWSIIMLRKTVFVACVNNLVGKGTPSGRAPTMIDLTWTGISGAASYDVLRGTADGGPYTKVGSSTLPAFSDTMGLSNGSTYFYVLQPLNNNGGAVCQSNQAKITVPAMHR